MSILANAKAKAARGNVKEAFKNEAGAIDLASIMVGIIVIGLIGGVIAATVFAVIPWAQDNAAKQQLDSVANAQSAYIGLSADGVAGAGAAASFGTKAQLDSKGLLAASAPVSLVTAGTGDGAHYGAIVKSASGSYFAISDTKTQPSAKQASAATAKTAAGVTGTWDATVS
jgi:type II secretory pathway pseudopilin PulG